MSDSHQHDEKYPILGTGLSGLVGSKFVELYQHSATFVNLDLSSGVNILDSDQVLRAVSASESPVIIHAAAYTDTQRAFEQDGDTKGPAFQVNVIGTRNVVHAAQKTGKYLLHISTAYVFDGEKNSAYLESDPVAPIEWYGKTKALAEDEVMAGCQSWSILRIDRPFRLDLFPKLDLLHKIKQALEEGRLPPQFSDTRWTPTSIEEFATILWTFVHHRPQGIFHTTTEPEYSDYSFALWVRDYYGIDREVQEGSLTAYLQSHPRPYHRNTALDTTKLRRFLSASSFA